MTYKQIEASRELRLWLGQVVIPVMAIAAIPEVRQTLADKTNKVKKSIQNKIKKTEL